MWEMRQSSWEAENARFASKLLLVRLQDERCKFESSKKWIWVLEEPQGHCKFAQIYTPEDQGRRQKDGRSNLEKIELLHERSQPRRTIQKVWREPPQPILQDLFEEIADPQRQSWLVLGLDEKHQAFLRVLVQDKGEQLPTHSIGKSSSIGAPGLSSLQGCHDQVQQALELHGSAAIVIRNLGRWMWRVAQDYCTDGRRWKPSLGDGQGRSFEP